MTTNQGGTGRSWQLAFALVCLGAAGCARDGSPEASGTTGTAAPPSLEVAPPKSAATPPSGGAVSPEIAQAVAALRDERACNRVSGCPAEDVLLAAGATAAPALAEAVAAGGRGANYFPRMVEILGRIGGADQLEAVRTLLDEPRWHVRASAAVALGRMGDRLSEPRLEYLGRNDASAAVRAATSFARVLLGDATAKEGVAVTLSEDGVRSEGWPTITFVIPLAVELKLTEALPGIRLAATHRDYFLRRTAAEALGALDDRASIPLLVGLTEDEMPGVRKRAMASLARLTGKSFPTGAGWKSWCEETRCAEAKAPD
jgi:HEAT repeat protein